MAKKENIPKAHHYVPQTYLRKFAFSKGKSFHVHVLDKNQTENRKIFSSNTKNICQETHLYTLNADKLDPAIVEKFFSKNIESYYNEVQSILTADSLQYITPEIRAKIIEYVVIQLYRSPTWKNRHTSLMNRVLERMFQLADYTGKDYFMFEDEKISIKGKTLEEVQKEWHSESKNGIIMTQLDVASRLTKLRLKTDSIMVSKIEDDKEFITSDNPVIYSNLSTSRPMPFDPTNILQMPISPKHLLMLMPYSAPEHHNLIVRKKCKGRESEIERLTANHSQLKSSERFLIGTKSGLEKYLETKEISERPLTEEEDKSIASREDLFKMLKAKGLI